MTRWRMDLQMEKESKDLFIYFKRKRVSENRSSPFLDRVGHSTSGLQGKGLSWPSYLWATGKSDRATTGKGVRILTPSLIYKGSVTQHTKLVLPHSTV